MAETTFQSSSLHIAAQVLTEDGAPLAKSKLDSPRSEGHVELEWMAEDSRFIHEDLTSVFPSVYSSR